MQLAEGLTLIGRQLNHAGRFAVLEQRDDAFHQRHLFLGFLVIATRLLDRILDPALEALEISQHQFCFNDFGITQGIDRAFHMGNVAILETAKHINNGIGFADIAEELVAETLALGGTAHQTGNIDKFELGRDDLC